MHAKLEALRNAWSPDNPETRDEGLARQLAEEFVTDNPDLYGADYLAKDIGELVRAVDVFREAGMEEEQWRVEAWLLYAFEPQTIGGEYKAKLKINPSDIGLGEE